MVYGFIIHTLGPGPNGSPKLSQVLYSRIFSCDLPDDKLQSEEYGLDKVRLRRKERVAIVARQTESMCLLRRQVSGKPASDYSVHLTDESILLQEEDVGVYSLGSGDPFPHEKIVLWVAVFSFGFSLICNVQENLTLAESTLRMLVKYLVESTKLLTHSSNILLRADMIEMSIDKFMPQGQLLFLNHQAVQALEKELSGSMTL
ncbi:AP-5 complex subunit sigma-1 [Pelobates cultripes]|uniref:AP-5 complex subunit sigma-1 n=1 Tax=Pelobates cultripes TaxID=61616 RepID=A0AAD1SDB6_PELCU|nr:AP-5 complex subunit sigma-1 [Pelobates cultripes]